MSDMIDYHEAIRLMHKGTVVKYVGTVNGNVMTERGCSFCMCRGIVFEYKNGKVLSNTDGCMIYDPDFRYKVTEHVVDPRYWP